MLGFGALGQFALGEGPFAPTRPVGSQWAAPVRKAGLAVAVIAGSFTGFVPQPPAQAAPVFTQFSQPIAQPKTAVQIGFTNAPQPAFVQPYVFGTFSQPLLLRNPVADEQPSTLFEVEPPQAPPFTGFATFEGIIRAKFNVALHATRWWQPITLPVDTHDGVWVKKKKKRGPDPIDLELEEKARRRAAIELAVYGPDPDISAQISPEKPVIHSPPPDVTDLVRIAIAMQQAEKERLQQEQIKSDEDDLEAILKDIL